MGTCGEAQRVVLLQEYVFPATATLVSKCGSRPVPTALETLGLGLTDHALTFMSLCMRPEVGGRKLMLRLLLSWLLQPWRLAMPGTKPRSTSIADGPRGSETAAAGDSRGVRGIFAGSEHGGLQGPSAAIVGCDGLHPPVGLLAGRVGVRTAGEAAPPPPAPVGAVGAVYAVGASAAGGRTPGREGRRGVLGGWGAILAVGGVGASSQCWTLEVAVSIRERGFPLRKERRAEGEGGEAGDKPIPPQAATDFAIAACALVTALADWARRHCC